MTVRYICLICLLAVAGSARSRVEVTIEQAKTTAAIPSDFVGLSFETANLLPDRRGEHLFRADNTKLVEAFRTLGIKSLRLGGGTADASRYAVPGPSDIDALFAFARAADVKVIYTLRLLNGDPAKAAEIARYIMQHYASQLDCFALGNEPDWISYRKADARLRDYPSYIKRWREFAAAVEAAAPGAKFEGPCTGSNFPDPGAKDTSYDGKSWTRNFLDDQKRARYLSYITQHDYPGGDAKDVTDPSQARREMLLTGWLDGYKILYASFADPALAAGVRYRLEEVSNFSGGVANASDTYAAALWALDFMHWWAAHGADGVNFHNRKWIPNIVIYPADSGYGAHPIAYGIEAFEEGGHGIAEPVVISNADQLNLTAYAAQDGKFIYLTIINKEFERDAREAEVVVNGAGFEHPQSLLRLAQRQGDLAAKSGIALGGSDWKGTPRWEPSGAEVIVPPASAVIIKIAKSST